MSYTYNGCGLVIDSVDGNGYSLDKDGNLVENSTAANDNTTGYTYDLLGHRLSETQPYPDGIGGPLAGPVTDYSYDADGNLTATTVITASPHETTAYTYDGMQRVVKTTNPDGTITENVYDAAGNLVAKSDEKGQWTQYVYDSRNRVVETIEPDGSVLTTGYDGGGNIVRKPTPTGTPRNISTTLSARKPR